MVVEREQVSEMHGKDRRSRKSGGARKRTKYKNTVAD